MKRLTIRIENTLPPTLMNSISFPVMELKRFTSVKMYGRSIEVKTTSAVILIINIIKRLTADYLFFLSKCSILRLLLFS